VHQTAELRNRIAQTAIALGDIMKQALQMVYNVGGAPGTGRRKAKAMRATSAQYQRAAVRAGGLVERAMQLSSTIPDKVYSCTATTGACRTIDRGTTLQSLGALYTEQVKQIARLMNTGRGRSRNGRVALSSMLAQAQELKAQGEADLAKCPRFEKNCG
jgi:hypothetical protein